MHFKMYNGACMLTAIQLLLSNVSAAPILGIRADSLDATGKTTDKLIQMYSSIFKFDDGTVPLDKTRMTNAKLLHLCVVAYNQKVDIWRTRNLASAALPGAMAAIAYKDKIYFASALRAPAQAVKFAQVPKGSVRDIMEDALTMGVGTHRHGGGCSEINFIELVWDHNRQQDPDKSPPKPRIAMWVLPRGKAIGIGSEVNVAPCKVDPRSEVGYGCAEIIRYYGLDNTDTRVAPDATGEDAWRFSLETNPRPPCQLYHPKRAGLLLPARLRAFLRAFRD